MKPNTAVPGVTTWGQKQVNLQRRSQTKQRYIPINTIGKHINSLVQTVILWVDLKKKKKNYF